MAGFRVKKQLQSSITFECNLFTFFTKTEYDELMDYADENARNFD